MNQATRALVDQHQLLRPSEAAAMLGVSTSWFKSRWDEFDTVKLSPRAYRIPLQRLLDYIEMSKT